MQYSDRTRGFSLVELMIAVVIIGILASIAIPQYRRSVTRAERADAMAGLQSAAAALERFKVSRGNFTYTGATIGPAGVFTNQVPVEGGTPYYNLVLVVAADGSTYTLTANPTGSMVGQDGPLTITNTGAKTWTNASGATRNCWPTSGNC